MPAARVAAMMLVIFATFGSILFGCAGRLDLPFFWGYLAVVVGSMVGGALVMDRGLIGERIRPGPGGVDRRLRILAMPFLLSHFVIAGLDARYHFSDTIPDGLRIAGLIAMAAMMLLVLWALKVNPFFSPVVRIQKDRGHYLVTTGPYAFIRHPGYANAILAFPCGALALGSWWALAPLAVPAALIFRRIVVEDRFLREHLDGYCAYAERVRFRIIPGVW